MSDKDIDRWKWIAGAMLSVLLFVFGTVIGNFSANAQMAVLESTVDAHADLPGHPVVIERVDRLEKGYTQRFDRLEKKLDEIARKLP